MESDNFVWCSGGPQSYDKVESLVKVDDKQKVNFKRAVDIVLGEGIKMRHL
jgi:hypothetical protein